MSQSPVTATSGNPADPDAQAAGSGGELTIRHNARIAGITCVIAFVLALAWLGKAVAGGSVWDWLAVLVLAVIAGIEFATLRDAGVPLLVADPTGIRIRRGTEWTGLPWLEIDKVRVRGRSGLISDGWIRILPMDGTEVSVPLTLTTITNQADIRSFLADLAPTSIEVLDDLNGAPELLSQVQEQDQVHEEVAAPDPGPMSLPETSSVRSARMSMRIDVLHRVAEEGVQWPRQREAHPEESTLPTLISATETKAGDPPGPEQSDTHPGRTGIIGSQLHRARQEAGLSIEALSERTQIRAHVLESMEADDFAACGGDFYARGHLRTVSRRLGLDAEQLVDLYDSGYAQAPVGVRAVFESDLMGVAEPRRSMAWGAPKWGLVLVVLVVTGSVWAGAQILTDPPTEVLSPAPGVVDSVGLAGSAVDEANPQSSIATLTVQSVGRASDVVVRDKNGRIIWADRLGPGKSHRVFGYAPFNVAASHGSAVHLKLLGKDIGTVSRTGGGADRTISLPTP